MKTVTVKFAVEKQTKNTVKFQEVEVPGQPPVIGTLYVQKWVVGAVQRLQLTLEVPETEDEAKKLI